MVFNITEKNIFRLNIEINNTSSLQLTLHSDYYES